MTQLKEKLFDNATRISRKLNFLPRGKVGVALNKAVGDIKDKPVRQFRANNGLIYLSDLRSYTENYVPWTGEYEGATMDKVLPLVPTDMNAMDIGANVGYWTVNLANTTSKNIYAFEPITSNYERVQQMSSLNGFEQRTNVYNIGLGDKSQKAGFEQNIEDQKNNSSTFNSAMKPGEGNDCSIETLDKIMKQEKLENIGFIKIDVEGFEIKFLHGAKKFFAQNRPIIYGEFKPEDIERYGDDPLEIFTFFSDYQFFKEQPDHSFKAMEKNQPYERDILLIPNEKVDSITSKFGYIY